MGFCEFEDKAKFVRGRLLQLAQAATDGDVASMAFDYRDGSETVTVVYRSNEQQEVDVTGDSLLMLAQDVLAGIDDAQ